MSVNLLEVARRVDETGQLLRVVHDPERGYAHLSPLPSREAVEARYAKDDAEYATVAGRAWLAREAAEHRAGLWRARHDWEAGLVGAKRFCRGKHLLDVGAGAGWFLRHWFDRGYGPAGGVEPSRTCRELALDGDWGAGVNLSCDLVSARPYLPPAGADVLRLALVLEHVWDPLALLLEYKQALKKGGLVLVVVPNEFNPLAELARKRRGDWFVSDRHLNYFTPETLRGLLGRAGFEVVAEGATCPTEWWPERMGPALHRARLRFERATGPLAFKLYTRLYHSFGIGRELVFVGRKK